jgi:hypothetical protein
MNANNICTVQLTACTKVNKRSCTTPLVISKITNAIVHTLDELLQSNMML